MTRLLAVVALLTACTGAPPATSPAPEQPAAPATTAVAGLDLDDPSACATCHDAIVTEWSGSMHARAHHEQDPVFAGLRSLRMKKEGEAVAQTCAQCHTPRDPANTDSAAARAGVSCATCHALSAVDTSGAQVGAAALTFSDDGVLRAQHDIHSAVAPHGVGKAAPWIADGTSVCLACHGQLKNGQDVVTCNTGPEHAASGVEQSCTDCHMPVVDGPAGNVSTATKHRSHGMLAGHGLWADPPQVELMKSNLEGRLSRSGDRLDLTLTATSGHHFPSAFPGRMVLVKVVGLDASGEVVWHNFTDDPMTQDPQAVFNTVYVDADGKPTLPPYGVSKKRDTRLAPGETRTLTWTVPAGVEKTKATLLYRLVPPPAVAPFGLEGAPEATAKPFLTIEE